MGRYNNPVSFLVKYVLCDYHRAHTKWQWSLSDVHDGKISPIWWGGGGCTVQIHSPYFSSTLCVLYGHHKRISAVLDISARQKVSLIKARKWFELLGKLNVYENLLSIGQHRYM